MNIEVHYGGYFGFIGGRTSYIGGKVYEISNFDSDMMSWFELRYMFKEIGLVNNYEVFQHVPDQSLEIGLVQINSDKGVLEMLKHLSLERNIVLYIITSAGVQKELLPDYCREDICTKEINANENDKGKSIMRDELLETSESFHHDVARNLFGYSDENEVEYENIVDEPDVAKVNSSKLVDEDEVEVEVDSSYLCKDSDYENSESLHTPANSSDGCDTNNFPTFNDRDLDHSSVEIGMEFESAIQFRTLMREQAIKGSFDLCWKRNDGDRIVVQCKATGCPYRVYVAWNSSTCRFQIRTLKPKHQCTRALSNTQITSSWLSKKFLSQFRADPKMKFHVFRELVQREIGVTISKSCFFRSKQKALDVIEGKMFEQFKKIREYAHALLESNPGSIALVKTKEIEGNQNAVRFEAVFIAYAACIQGLVKGCRPIIGLDGCHLTSQAGGICLSAISRDPNNHMFPIAIAVVEVENKTTWSWFLNILVDSVGVENLQGLTFLTDRQKWLVESLKNLVPNADVRFCVRHLYANFKEKYKGLKLKRLLWQAAASYNKHEHVEAMKEMEKINVDAFNYLNAIDKKLWTRSHFDTNTRCDLLCNNISESFNKFILDARDKPIITMLEMIRRQLMTRFQMKRDQIAKWQSPICPKINEKLSEISVKSRDCSAFYAGMNNFEVREAGSHCCVNLFDRYCDCKEWMLTGIPCRHAMAAIRYSREDPISYTHDCYYTDKYKDAYEGIIFPIPDSSHWKQQDGFEILLPKARRQPGRPPKVRKKAPEEERGRLKIGKAGQEIKCSLCKQKGHNRRRCRSNNSNSGATSNTSGRKIGRTSEAASTSSRRGIRRATSIGRVRSSSHEVATPMSGGVQVTPTRSVKKTGVGRVRSSSHEVATPMSGGGNQHQ